MNECGFLAFEHSLLNNTNGQTNIRKKKKISIALIKEVLRNRDTNDAK